MIIHAIVPVKELRRAKQRLAQVLDTRERQALSLAMLDDVLVALSRSPVSRIVVIGRDVEARHTAYAHGAAFVMDRSSTLNDALYQAAADIPDHAAMLVAPSDLPLLGTEDVIALTCISGNDPGVAIAPAHDGGTNLLLVNPVAGWTFLFGPDSLTHHIAEATRRQLPVHLLRLPHLERDIDDIDDLIWLTQQPGNTSAQRLARMFLEQKGAQTWQSLDMPPH
ncbi:MAG: 2-phospho-L-lactate guanylyltransferase [Roseiflexus sp.]